MKYLISKKQFDLILEQPESVMDRKVQGAKALFNDTIIPWIKNNPEEAYFIGTLAAWFVPYIGPYLAGLLGTRESINYFQDGKYQDAIFSLMTSPISLGRNIRLLKFGKKYTDKISDSVIKRLEFVQKAGIPVFIAKGKEEFYEWLYENFTEDENKEITEALLYSMKMGTCESITKLKEEKPETYNTIYSKLSPKNKMDLQKMCGISPSTGGGGPW